MKYLLSLIFQLVFTVLVIAQTNPNHVWVNGYYRSNGTYVRGHYRTAPNHTNVDNFSTTGNTNPYTLKRGWVKSDGQINPWKRDQIEREKVEIEPYYGSSTYIHRKKGESTDSQILSKFSTTNTSLKSENNYWYSKGDQVNVRFNPSTDSPIAFRINRGDLIQIIRKSESKENISGYGNHYWYEILYKELTGWVFGALIGERNYDSSELDEWNGDFQYVDANSVNVRTEPNVRIGKVLFQVNKFQKIEILAKTTQTQNVGDYGTDYWYYIKANNRTGWVFGGLIKLE